MHEFFLKTRFTGKTHIVEWSGMIILFFVRKRMIFYKAHMTSIFNFVALNKHNQNNNILWKLVTFKIVCDGLEVEFWKSKFNVPCKKRFSFKKKSKSHYSVFLSFSCKACFWTKYRSCAGSLNCCIRKLILNGGYITSILQWYYNRYFHYKIDRYNINIT